MNRIVDIISRSKGRNYDILRQSYIYNLIRDFWQEFFKSEYPKLLVVCDTPYSFFVTTGQIKLTITIKSNLPLLSTIIKQRKDEIEGILQAYCEDNNIVKSPSDIILKI